MRQYINTSNYYLWVTTTVIDDVSETGTFEVDSVENEHVTLPTKWFYWLDVDFTTSWEREIFRITWRVWNTLTYDKRISPTWKFRHEEWTVVWLRDFAELFNSLSSNTDNFWQVEQVDNVTLKIYWWNVFIQWWFNRLVATRNFLVTPNNQIQYLHFDSSANVWSEYVLKNEQDPYLYLLAAITTDTSSITWIEDLRWMFLWAALWFLKIDWSEPMEWDLDMHWYKIKNAKMDTSNTYLWADEEAIAWFDSWKHLISLNTDTYPNLTELSYLKWVSSNVQHQIDSKWDVAYNDFVWEDASSWMITINRLNTKTSSSSDLVIKAWNIKNWLVYMLRITADSNINIIPWSWVSNYAGINLSVPAWTTKMFVLLATSDSELEFQWNEWWFTGNKIFTTISEIQAWWTPVVIPHWLWETPKTIACNWFINFGPDDQWLNTLSRVLITWTIDWWIDFLWTLLHFSDWTLPWYWSNLETLPLTITANETNITLSCTYYSKIQITAYL